MNHQVDQGACASAEMNRRVDAFIALRTIPLLVTLALLVVHFSIVA